MLPATELQQLTSFVTIADAGSMSGAADILYTGAATVSAHLRKLEGSLGTVLFDRSGQGLRLTAAGQQFLLHARKIVAEAAAVSHTLQQLSKTTGTVKIGLPPIVAKTVSSRLLTRSLARYPDVLLRLQEGYSWDVCDWLDAGKVDIGLFYKLPGPSSEFATAVAREDLLLVGPLLEGHDGVSPIELGAILDLPLILPGVLHGHRMQIERFAARQERQLQIAVEVNSLGALLALVEAGAGYALLPRAALPHHWADLGLLAVPFRGQGLKRTLLLGTSIRRPVSPLARAFMPILQGLFA